MRSFLRDLTQQIIEVKDVVSRSISSPSAGVWYLLNVGLKIVVPPGTWDIEWTADGFADGTGTSNHPNWLITLATATNTETDRDFTASGHVNPGATAGANRSIRYTASRRKRVKLNATTTFYLLMTQIEASFTSVGVRGDTIPTIIRATRV